MADIYDCALLISWPTAQRVLLIVEITNYDVNTQPDKRERSALNLRYFSIYKIFFLCVLTNNTISFLYFRTNIQWFVGKFLWRGMLQYCCLKKHVISVCRLLQCYYLLSSSYQKRKINVIIVLKIQFHRKGRSSLKEFESFVIFTYMHEVITYTLLK